MRFSITALFAFATAVMAQTEGFNVITKPVKGEQVPAGSTYEIVWEPSAAHPGEITIGLLGGSSPQTLSVVDTIATAVDGETGSYSWSVPSDLGDLETYGIMITLESDTSVFQYGFPFQIVAGEGGSSSSVEPTATATDSETSETSTTSSKPSTKTASTSVTSTSFSIPSSTIVSSTIRGNLSTTAGHSSTITTSVTSQTATETSTSTSSIATNGVASLAAGSFAMLGGVAMAVLAL